MSQQLPINTFFTGDCIEIMNSLPAKSIDLIFADPPYNMQLDSSLQRPNATEVASVDDEWDQFTSLSEYDDFSKSWLMAARRVLKDTGTLWVIGSYHNIYRVGAIIQDLGYWILNDVVWIKNNPMPQMKGVRFCSAQETMLWVKKSQTASGYTFNYRGAKAGNEDLQMRSDWYFPICLGGERIMAAGKKAHSTQKPEALLHRIITTTSNPGDLILDPFCGSGTTAAVAHKLGRNFITIDKEQKYIDIARERIRNIVPTLTASSAVWVDAPPARIPFASLVETGVLKAGQHLKIINPAISATILEDGSIEANGIRGSIHKVGTVLLKQASCNGWTTWYYYDEITSHYRLINELRK